jgi:hypothetical protein
MALTRQFSACSNKARPSRPKNHWKILIFAALLVLPIAIATPVCAQLQQPFVFSSAGAVASRNDQTGDLAAVAGSPYTTAGTTLTLDVQGRYLFAPGTNSIHMYAITNSATGAYQEVANSPFASPNTNQPLFIAVEPTGNFIAVVNRASQGPGAASVETFTISPTAVAGPALIPVPGSATELDSTPVGVGEPPSNKEFFIFMGPNPDSQNTTIQNGSEFQALSINSQTGLITGLETGNASDERGLSFALDPQGRYYVLGTRDNLLEVGNIQVIGITGEISGSDNLALPQFNYPEAFYIDATGSFLYATISDLANPTVVNIYSVNLQNAQLTETTSSPLPGATAAPPYYPDPTGSFNYGFGSDANTAIAYSVDPLTGYFLETADSPFTIPQIAGALTFSVPPGGQGISGPSALLSASSLSFGSLQTGTISSPPQTITLTNNGGEALSVNSVSLSGADPSQFLETDTCQAPTILQPAKFCSINITFAPTNTGSQQASLIISDNAPGSPQSVTLTGAGVAPPPPEAAVTINPNPVNFPAITQGTTGSPVVITVTNSGNASLSIASVVIGGNNVSDFTTTNSCSASPYAPNAQCTITVTFAPLAAGQRTETITLTDNAPDSPQVINVSGNANPAVFAGPAPNGSTSQTVAAGETAQFNLQLTPGVGYSGTIGFSCGGAPAGAACTVPSSVQVSAGNSAPFTVSVTTTGAAAALPFENAPPWTRSPGSRIIATPTAAMIWFLFFLWIRKRKSFARLRRVMSAGALCCAAAFALLGAGCGGGGYSAPPPPAPTPQGTTTITVTQSGTSLSGQPLQLPPIQLTLTVN